MSIEYTPWPDEFARQYRRKGYWIDRPLSDILQHQHQMRPDAVAIVCGDRQWSYRQFEQQASALAANLTRAGLCQGDTALVQLPNVAEFYLTFFALLKMGVAPVNALFSHNRLELTSYAHLIAPRLLVASRRHSLFADDGFLRQLQAQHPTLNTVLLDGSRDERDLQNWLTPDDSSLAYQPSDASDVAFFQLSGGTTGTPKLIPRTHNDYYYSVRRSAEICRLTHSIRYLCALPAAHNYPLSSPGALGVFYAGGRVVLADDPSPMTCFPLIKQHQIDITSLVPPAAALWIQSAAQYPEDLASLKLLQVGGARLSDSVARRIPEQLGCQLQQVLGMAEGLVNYTRLDDDDEHIFTTQGRPMCPDDEVKVVDKQGNQVAAGAEGLLVTRGPYTIRGYYRSPEHNVRSFDSEGFYHSGDVVRMTEDGYLSVVGREKDQINRGGEKIAAEEIENLLLKHGDVIHAALVAMPDPMLGEKSCAFIVSTDPRLNTLGLRKYLRSQGIAEYKLPDRIELIDSLPVTPVGKIDKRALRESIQK
ncbi:(2,3-dihydroxybenzoyl)adenylate synthase [Brenneria goodwinii]|uniref:(2,3-dihydroxybenzoyl)adenylate synthase n=1 Tax=Brenneria goodwinii TaxID=1109412 RepID=UPI0036E0A08C